MTILRPVQVAHKVIEKLLDALDELETIASDRDLPAEAKVDGMLELIKEAREAAIRGP